MRLSWHVHGGEIGRHVSHALAAMIDAIDLDKARIDAVADRLFRRGYGVMRQRKTRAGKVHYLLKAAWVGPGQPPDEPFEGQ